MIPFSPAIVYANTKYPELNNGFESVHAAENISGKDSKSHYHGFTIITGADIRYILDHNPDSDPEPYQCKILTPNTLLFTLPSSNYCMYNDRNNWANQIESSHPWVVNAIDDHNHQLADDFNPQYTDDPDPTKGKFKRLTKKLLLVFPAFVELSAEVITMHEEDEDKAQIFPQQITNAYQFGAGNHQSYNSYLAWTVARMDVSKNKKGRVEHKSRASRLQSQFGAFAAAAPRPNVTPSA